MALVLLGFFNKALNNAKLSVLESKLIQSYNDGLGFIRNGLYILKTLGVNYTAIKSNEKFSFDFKDFSVKGFFDLRENDSIYEIKTTVNPETYNDYTQPIFYCFLFWRFFNKIPSIKVIFLKAMKIKDIKVSFEDFKRLATRMKLMAINVNSSKFQRSFMGCRYCQFKTQCYGESWDKLKVVNNKFL